jgi:NAD(P)-dependent dehydrogenase (short-subunit alcohol dehydrogenase family)
VSAPATGSTQTRPARLGRSVVVVTGACGGIGRATTLRLAADGPDAIVVLDADASIESLADSLRTAGTRALGLRVDCMNEGEIADAFRQVHDTFGRVDVLVNTVGGSARGKVSEFWCSEPATWRHVIDLSLLSAMLCSRQVAPGMRERQRGKIVNIASSMASLPGPTLVDYSAAKAGVVGFTRGLALELAPFGVNVNAVSPGPTRTRAIEELPAAVKERSLKQVPMGRFGEPIDIANAVAFLACDESSYITGHNLAVSGGKVFN